MDCRACEGQKKAFRGIAHGFKEGIVATLPLVAISPPEGGKAKKQTDSTPRSPIPLQKICKMKIHIDEEDTPEQGRIDSIC